MAIANLLIKIGADIAELKTGADKSVAVMEKTGDRIDRIAGTIKSTLLGALSVGAVVNFGKELLKMGDDIVRTADRTGLLTDEVQRLSFIASQSGNSIDELTGGIGQMQNRLASGDKSALGAIKDLGLSFDTLRRQSPYDEFISIATAIDKVEDPAKRAEIAMDIFGKSGIALLPTLTAKVRELGDAAPIMSEQTVRALDDAGDALDRAKLRIKVFGAGAIDLFSHTFDGIVLLFYPMIAKLLDGLASIDKAFLKIPGAAKVFPGLQKDFDGLTQSAQWFRDAANAQTHQLDLAAASATRTHPVITKLGEETKKTTAHTKAHTAAIAEQIPLTSQQIQVLNLVAKAHEHQAATLAIEADAFKASQKAVSDYLANLPTANVLLQGRDLSGMVAQVVATAGSGVPPAARDSLFTSIFGTSAEFGGRMASTIMGAITGGGNALNAAIGTLGQALTTHLAKVLTGGMGTAIGGALGGAINAILPGLGALLGPIAGKIGSFFAGLFNRSKGRDLVEDFASGFGGFDALHRQLNDLGSEGEALWIRLTQGVGKNNPQQAQAAIDAINDALTRQKEKQDEAAAAATKAGDAQSEASQKAKDAIAALDNEMNSLLKSIANEAPEEVMGVVESQTRERIAAIARERDAAQQALDSTAQEAAAGAEEAARIIDETLRNHDFRVRIHFDSDEIPGGGHLPGFASGTGGRYLNFGAGTLAVLHGRERVVTEHEPLGVEGGGHITLSAPEALALLRGEIVSTARQDAARGGLRPRAAHGRSY